MLLLRFSQLPAGRMDCRKLMIMGLQKKSEEAWARRRKNLAQYAC
jgi:hypothetical protein